MPGSSNNHHNCVAPNPIDIPETGAGGVPVGSISMWSTAVAPANWLIADGSYVSRTTYSDLFSVMGTTWGAGDGTPIPMSYTQIIESTSVLHIYMVSALSSSWTLGTVFTMTGGRTGYSTYVWTVSVAPTFGSSTFSATATLNGVPVTNLPSGVDSTAGNIFITNPTNFTLPDIGNRMVRGTKNGTLAPNAKAGAELTSVTLVAANLPPHRHGFSTPGLATIQSGGAQSVLQSVWNASQIITNANQTYAENGSTPVASLPFDVATTNVYVAIPYIVKYA